MTSITTKTAGQHSAVKKAALIITVGIALSACDSLQITGGPLEFGAATAGNLLDHGGFERGFGAWRSCADPALVTIKSNDLNNVSSAVFDAGGCLYQTVPAQVNDNMIVNCSALKSSINWASLTFGYLDENHQPLKTVEAEIPTTSFTNVSASLRAPSNTAYAEVLVYTEDGGEIDDCELINTQEGVPAELLSNSYFEEGLDGWQTCSHGTVIAENDMASINDSCISQKFTASPGLALRLTCDAVKVGSEHAAVALGYIDANNQGIEVSEAVISTEEGSYPTVTMTAPASTSFVQAMIYTEGQADLTSCSLRQVSSDQ